MNAAIDSEKLVRWYDFQASFYGLWRNRLGRPVARSVAREASKLSGAEWVLDAGCGTGLFTTALARALPAARVEGLDLSSGMLAVARREVRRLALTNVRLWRGEVSRLPFRDGAFDLVVAAGLLPNVNDRPRVLRELARVLDPAGRLLIVEIDRDAIRPLARCSMGLMILGYRLVSALLPRFRFCSSWDTRASTVDRRELERELVDEDLRATAETLVHGHAVLVLEKGVGR